jgi:hypothetical protein
VLGEDLDRPRAAGPDGTRAEPVPTSRRRPGEALGVDAAQQRVGGRVDEPVLPCQRQDLRSARPHGPWRRPDDPPGLTVGGEQHDVGRRDLVEEGAPLAADRLEGVEGEVRGHGGGSTSERIHRDLAPQRRDVLVDLSSGIDRRHPHHLRQQRLQHHPAGQRVAGRSLGQQVTEHQVGVRRDAVEHVAGAAAPGQRGGPGGPATTRLRGLRILLERRPLRVHPAQHGRPTPHPSPPSADAPTLVPRCCPRCCPHRGGCRPHRAGCRPSARDHGSDSIRVGMRRIPRRTSTVPL